MANDGIVLIGGLVGELIISFTCLLDYILADPKHQHFAFTPQMIEQFLLSLITEEWPDGVCSLTINKPLEEIAQGRDLGPGTLAKAVREKQNLADFGLKYMLEITRDLALAPDIVEGVFASVCKIATKKKSEIQEVPSAPAAGQDPADFEAAVQSIMAANEQAEAENEKYGKIQPKFTIKVRSEEDYDEENEKALVKLNNWRETVVNDAGQIVNRAE